MSPDEQILVLEREIERLRAYIDTLPFPSDYEAALAEVERLKAENGRLLKAGMTALIDGSIAPLGDGNG